MRSFIVLFLMALASPEEAPAPEVAAPEVAAPEVALGLLEERTETLYYDVHGQTPYALASSLAARGPKHHGERYFGMTEWTLRASYGRRTEAGACRLTDVAVHLDVEISLPRWDGAGTAHPAHAAHDLRSDWDEFVEALDATSTATAPSPSKPPTPSAPPSSPWSGRVAASSGATPRPR